MQKDFNEDLSSGIYHAVFGTYWGPLIDSLWPFAHMVGPRVEDIKEIRLDLYDQIRERSGLDFPDYGDDADRWLLWMRTNDTNDKAAAKKLRDENLRRRAAGLEGIYDWSAIADKSLHRKPNGEPW